MKKVLVLTLILTALVFAQEVNWWVFDGGGGMREPDLGDTLYASIGQPVIGCRIEGSMSICAGYLCLFEGACVKIDEEPEDQEDGKQPDKPYAFGINSVSPNPFNPTTKIEFEIETEKEVTFEIYDVLGKKVDTPIKAEIMTPGRYELTWGGNLPSGTYFARLESGSKSEITRMVYLK